MSRRRAGYPGSDTDGAAGFTLIELTVVVAVLSVLAIGVGLSATRSTQSAAGGDPQRFERYMQTARARAIQGRQTLGLFMTGSGYTPAEKSADVWEKRAQPTRWRAPATLQLKTTRRVANTPHIVILPNGRITAFTLSFAPQGSSKAVCSSDGNAEVTCDYR